MKIKVILKHYQWTLKDGVPLKQYDKEEEQIFNYNEEISIGNWKKPVKNLQECFDSIVQYFKGTNYDIVDFLKMED